MYTCKLRRRTFFFLLRRFFFFSFLIFLVLISLFSFFLSLNEKIKMPLHTQLVVGTYKLNFYHRMYRQFFLQLAIFYSI